MLDHLSYMQIEKKETTNLERKRVNCLVNNPALKNQFRKNFKIRF